MMTPWPLVTDQQACYDIRGAEIHCGGSGQDADHRPMARAQAERFRCRGDTVTDTLSGLCWSRNANPFDFPYTWREAFDLIDGMNRSAALGRTDWRLPSRREMFSIVSHQHINPALPIGHPFRDVFPGYYWTASPCARLPEQAWYVHLGGARVYRGMRKGSYLAWPVAGPEMERAPQEDRFRSEGRVVEDRWTGLFWMPAVDSDAPVTWQTALETPGSLNQRLFGGRSDWRLPNIRELESLVDLTRHSPALSPGHPFEAVPFGCWSSTTSVYEPRYAWVLYTQDGAVGVGFKPEAAFGAWVVAGSSTASGVL